MTLAVTDVFAFYARIGAALFPIPAGQKNPTGIVKSFAQDCSTDPEQWKRWRAEHPGCNFGVVAGPSLIIIVDIDAKDDPGAAWAMWVELCASWGIAKVIPHVKSARGGWHVYFVVPAGVDSRTLRQPDAVKKLINIRAGNGFTVAAGSYYDGTAKGEASGHYTLVTEAAQPYQAPQALVEHCLRRSPGSGTVNPNVGSRDIGDVAGLVRWLAERDAFAAYEDWVGVGMALKLEFGDAGREVWGIAHDRTVTADVEATKWQSFAAEPTPGVQTLNTWLKRAKDDGWTGSVRKSLSAMFHGDGVTQMAAAAGAGLSGAKTDLLAVGQQTVAAKGQDILDQFLAGTKDSPSRPKARDYPTLPAESMSNHPIYEMMLTAIDRIMAMAEDKKTFRQDRVLKVLGVLSMMHRTTFDALCQRITAEGGVLAPAKLDGAVKNFEWAVRTEFNTAAGFKINQKGEPVPENSDNVHVFVRQRAVKLRYNIWKDHAEISDADKDEFGQLTDHIFGDLLMDAKNSYFNYHPAEGLFRRGLVNNARRTMFDPVVEKLDDLAEKWDRTPRLTSWLTQTCGVPSDQYHEVVGRNLIGGLVRRARHPGCEQAETVIFISPTQGTGKSTLCKILALDPSWHTDSLKFGGSQQNTIPQMAGKWVIELSELAGMSKAAVEEIKNFMSATTDNYTKKYEAFATDHKRRCVFIGTSNDKRPLVDATGNRRFLPVHVVGEVNTDWLRANVEQIMGEAAWREANGESFAIPREVWELAGQHQEAARAMTPVEELCYEWFDRPVGSYFITASDLNRALKMAGQNGRYSGFLDKLGWRNENLVIPKEGRKCRVWVCHTNNRLEDCARLEPHQREPNARVEMRVPLTFAPGPLTPPPMPSR